MAKITIERPATEMNLESDSHPPSVELLARRRLAENTPYAFYFKHITVSYSRGTLTLEGRLPSFYLKQVLQTLLWDLDDVARIDNRVDVVSQTGLSSVRPM